MAPPAPVPANPAAPDIEPSDLIASLPAPILRLLILFSQPIAWVRHALEVLLWKPGRRVESWLVVLGWWGISLGSGYAFVYLLPPLVFLPLLPLRNLRLTTISPTKKQPTLRPSTQSSPSTPTTLLLTLSDLHAIHALLPPSPLPTLSATYDRFLLLGPLRLTRALLILWATWLVIGHLLTGFKSLLAILGTLLLLLPSPSLAHTVNLLGKSLFVRRTLALLFLFVFGSPPGSGPSLLTHFSPVGWAKAKWATSRRPSFAFAFRQAPMAKPSDESAIADDEEATEVRADPIYFRFELHENQRWWMGLDWTSALLPQERPSWCDSHLLPASPPPSFQLPSSSSIVIPTATMKDRYARIRRTAVWKWLDDDWSIVRAGPAAGAGYATASTGKKEEKEKLSPDLSVTDMDAATSGFAIGHVPSRSVSISGTSPPQASSATVPSDESSSTTTTTAAAVMSPTARAQSIAEQAFTKGLERLKARTSATPASSAMGTSPSRSSGEFIRRRTGSQASDELHTTGGGDVIGAGTTGSEDAKVGLGIGVGGGGAGSGAVGSGETIPERDEATDAEGWVYGDNKWENMGAKGGLGKFTRRRRWQRRAILTETITKLLPTDEPVLHIPVADADRTSPVAAVAALQEAERNKAKQRQVRGSFGSTGSERRRRSSVLATHGEEADEDHDQSRGKGEEDKDGDGEGEAVVRGVIIPPGSPHGNAEMSRDDVLRLRLKKALGNMGG